MILHKLLRGEGAEKYLPFALSRLRALERIYGTTGFFAQKFEIEGYSIEVQQAPPFQYVRITGVVTHYFEAFYSDAVDGYFYATPGYRYFEIGGPYFIGGIQGGGYRVGFSTGGTKPRAQPIYSTNLDPGKPPKWAHKDIFDVGMPLATQSKDFFKIWASWQVQRVGEAVWYPDNKPDAVVTSCWGTPMGRKSMVGWGDYHWGDIVGAFRPPYDILYDLAPALYHADGTVLGVLGPYLGNNCWWRHGAMQTVEGRKFFIVGDNKGRLHVYPAKAYWSNPYYYNSLVTVYGFLSSASANITFRTVEPTYPAWVTRSPVGTLDTMLWWNWNFNKDATKAAAIALHEQPRVGYHFYGDPSVYDPTNVSTWRGYLDSQFNDDPDHGLFHTSKKGPPPRVLTPGLIEIKINISITGPDDMDFVVTTETLRTDYFGDSGRYYQDAGYLYDKVKVGGTALPEDTLVTSEVQVYSDDGTWYVRKIPDDNPPNFYHLETHPDTGELWFRGDPALYTEGYDIVGASPTATWVVRRQDTGVEIIREMMSYQNNYGDWFFPIGLPLTYTGPDGFGGTQVISGIWLHNFMLESQFSFFSLGAGHGPLDGYYSYGGIESADLRSLSYVTYRNRVSYTGDPVIDTAGHPTGQWHPRTQTEHYQLDLYGFGEHKEALAVEVYSAFHDDDFLGHPPVFTGVALVPPGDPAVLFHEPATRVPLDPMATMVYSAVVINDMNLQAYLELKTHPRGHLSCCSIIGGSGGSLDVLTFKNPKGKEIKTTHQKMFNAAFKQNRSVDFYSGAGSYGFEAGSFRLTGFWLPYTEK